MTVAEMIKKTRLDNNMTQEAYANKFGVTRQTVSSWENGKSIPDLQLIITICNTYHLSLDSLLNEDYKYVKKIDMTQKIVRVLKRILPVICIAICVYAVIFCVWKITASKANEEFASRVQDMGFSLENGLYVMQNEDTIYELPNQKMPFMKREFNLQQITATYRNTNFSCNIILNYDEQQYLFSIDCGIDKHITGTITNDGTLEYNDLSEDVLAILNEYKSTIENILYNMVTYYNTAYNL